MQDYRDLIEGENISEAKMRIPNFIKVGSEFVDASGYRITIREITVMEMHKRKPRVLISYKYEEMDGDNSGYEDNYLDHFMDIITGRYKSSWKITKT